MRWALDLIANMYGPKFLGFYLAACAFVLFASWWAVRRRSDDEAAVAIPPKPDPYFIAFLDGGAEAVTRLSIFELLRKGWLQQRPRTSRQAELAPAVGVDGQPLTKFEQDALDWFGGSARTPREIFRKRGLGERFREGCEPFQADALERGLLTPPERKQQAIGVGIVGVGLILGLGLFKLIAALDSNHNNVVGLVIVGILGSIAVAATCMLPRLSRAGRRLLRDLRLAHGGLRTLWSAPDVPPTAPALALSLFGPSILVGTPFANYAPLFQPAAAGAAGGCGSSGTSSCGGGGGGGGGGCGGGGCGGCGGG
jgi:uncharacterized protein (TIGR04222 family)